MTYGVGKAITAVGRIAAWRVSHGYLQDTESEILANFAASDEPFQPEDRGLMIVGIKAGMLIIILSYKCSIIIVPPKCVPIVLN